MALPPSPTGLYWSVKGVVACPTHAPEPLDPRWAREKWAPIDPELLRGFSVRYQCQTCYPTPIAHAPRKPQDDSFLD